jgi:hypothetical protein
MSEPLKIEGRVLSLSEYYRIAVVLDRDIEKARKDFRKAVKVKIL